MMQRSPNPSAHALYLREWRARNPDKVKQQSKRLYAARKHRPRASRRKNAEAKCVHCEILLTSRFGGKTRRKYCDYCIGSYKRALYNLYQRRKYQKKHELPQDALPTRKK